MRKRLIELRKKKGLTQKEIAKELGISAVFLRKIEAGTRQPSIPTMLKFEAFYDESFEELFPDVFQVNKDTKSIKKETG